MISPKKYASNGLRIAWAPLLCKFIIKGKGASNMDSLYDDMKRLIPFRIMFMHIWNKSSQWLPNTPFASISECLVS